MGRASLESYGFDGSNGWIRQVIFVFSFHKLIKLSKHILNFILSQFYLLYSLSNVNFTLINQGSITIFPKYTVSALNWQSPSGLIRCGWLLGPCSTNFSLSSRLQSAITFRCHHDSEGPVPPICSTNLSLQLKSFLCWCCHCHCPINQFIVIRLIQVVYVWIRITKNNSWSYGFTLVR